jgi:hypothetical protein
MAGVMPVVRCGEACGMAKCFSVGMAGSSMKWRDETGTYAVGCAKIGFGAEGFRSYETSHAGIIRIGFEGLSQRCKDLQGTPVSSWED